ncbi:ABC-type multidrug transport system, permease component [Aciduliprofundum sp. MAR08-339]|uniref:ABC transporter permease n=1 Tax=Aciduliprofundum sp. (strain MAR08-339) TaxID=673860 RepID=UPI0002A49A69|nr:ABC-type multidrug transport system, permease component [Aciduliprofundum sp. MAR08-339]
MRGIYAFLWKGLKEFFSSKEAVFWVFIFPIIFGLLFASVFGTPTTPQNIPVGYIISQQNSTLSQSFIKGMEKVSIQNHTVFELHKYANLSEGISAIKESKIKALILFNENSTDNSNSRKMNIKIVFDKRDLHDYQIVSGSVFSYISSFENRVRDFQLNVTVRYILEHGNLTISERILKSHLESLANPVNLNLEYYTGTSNVTSNTRVWYATAAIGITLVFSGMTGTASSISREIERGTARRLTTTKTRSIEMLLGILLYFLVIQLISAFLVIISFIIVFREWISLSPPVLGMIIIAALSTMAIGLLISTFTKTQKAASAAANAIAWPISFITGIFFPSFLLPDWMRVIGDYFPASALLRGIRKIIIFNQSIGNYMPMIILAIIVTIVLLVIGSFTFQWRIKNI